jgi:hypothetical protein
MDLDLEECTSTTPIGVRCQLKVAALTPTQNAVGSHPLRLPQGPAPLRRISLSRLLPYPDHHRQLDPQGQDPGQGRPDQQSPGRPTQGPHRFGHAVGSVAGSERYAGVHWPRLVYYANAGQLRRDRPGGMARNGRNRLEKLNILAARNDCPLGCASP